MKTKIPAVEKLTVGLDLGDRQHHACVLDASGDILAEEVIVNTREVLTAFCARYPGATVVMETGTHSPWVSRLVAAQGHPVISPQELTLDRLLEHYETIAVIAELDVLEEAELRSFTYQFRTVFENVHVQEYLRVIDDWFAKKNTPEAAFLRARALAEKMRKEWE
jgi:hypothetical protein